MYFRILSYQVFFDTVQTSSQMVFIGKKTHRQDAFGQGADEQDACQHGNHGHSALGMVPMGQVLTHNSWAECSWTGCSQAVFSQAGCLQAKIPFTAITAASLAKPPEESQACLAPF